MKSKTTILILGATGMLGHTLLRKLSQDPRLKVFGTTRTKTTKSLFPIELSKKIFTNVNVENDKYLLKLFNKVKPDVVINCVGLIKQIESSEDPLQAIPINALLPHRLTYLTKQVKARLILMSTDCVFSGKKGNYKETDKTDCNDLYGQSKLLGEITDQSHVLTIRTSIIGHELRGGHSLIHWFLKQKNSVAGYINAIYSGLPTVELANIIQTIVLPSNKLSGLYQISADPISKYDLLKLVSKIYNKKIRINKVSTPKINRSLSYSKFKRKTGYKPKSWPLLIEEMHADYLQKY